MSSMKRFILSNVRCPDCKWFDAEDDHQLTVWNFKIAPHEIAWVLKCSECGSVNRMTATFANFDLEVEKLEYTVPTKSIIPF